MKQWKLEIETPIVVTVKITGTYGGKERCIQDFGGET
jgi:hypothetical protein